jgi:hypothetical protein
MNWRLVTSVALALQAPYSLGMASSSSNGTVLTTVSSVSVKIAESDAEQTMTLTDDGSGSPAVNILLKFQDDISAIAFDRDYLNLPTDVGVSFSTTNATSYPAEEAYSKLYPPENVVPLGPLLSFEFLYSAIKFNDDAAQKVVIVVPLLSPQYRGFFDPADPLGVEVRIKRADGSESFSLEEYVAGGVITVFKGVLDRAYGDTPPDIISVSVQPVDYSGVLKQGQ